MLKGGEWKCETEGQGQNGLSSCKKRSDERGSEGRVSRAFPERKRDLVDCETAITYQPNSAVGTLNIIHFISNRFFQCFSFIIGRVHQNSPPMHFRRANTDSGGPKRIQDGLYETVNEFKANTKPSMHFRRANT